MNPLLFLKIKKSVPRIEDKVISLYAKGLSAREINEQIQDLYGIEVSATMIRNITDAILPKIKDWKTSGSLTIEY